MKKNIKKILTLVLTCLMIIGLYHVSAPNVFAADEGSLTIHKLSSEPDAAISVPTPGYHEYDKKYYAYLGGAEYTIYEIGTLAQSEGPTISVSYTPIVGLKDNDDNPITELNDNTDPSTINVSSAGTGNPKTTTTAGPITFNGLAADKVYLVKETKTPANVHKANDFIITIPMYVKEDSKWTWKHDVEAYPKNIVSEPTIAKVIMDKDKDDNDKETSIYYANIGDVVKYKIEVNSPSDLTSVSYTTFKIVDKSKSEYLGIDTSTVVVSDGKFIKDIDYTLSYIGTSLAIDFKSTGIAKIKDKEIITVTYDAKIKEGYISTKDSINNEAVLVLNYGQNDDETIESIAPDPVVKIYSYGVKKVNENTVALAGAKFVVTDSSDNYLKYDAAKGTWSTVTSIGEATAFESKTNGTGTDSEAILQFINLDKGTYYLVETEAPDGYTKLPESIKIEVTESTTDVVYASYNEGIYQTGVAGEVGFTTSIKNTLFSDNPGFLPSTGGSGIYIFLFTGGILVAGALVLFFVSKKREEEKN